MKINLELYASLMPLLPPGKGRFKREITVQKNTTLQQLIERFGISDEQAHIVLVNGHFICGDDRIESSLEKNDTVSIWPPVAGG